MDHKSDSSKDAANSSAPTSAAATASSEMQRAQMKQKRLRELTPDEREIIDVIARSRGGIENVSIQEINLALDQARAIGDL
jgi:hypothetical protein